MSSYGFQPPSFKDYICKSKYSEILIQDGDTGSQYAFPYPVLLAMLPNLEGILPVSFPDVPTIITLDGVDELLLLKLSLFVKVGNVTVSKVEGTKLVNLLCGLGANSEQFQLEKKGSIYEKNDLETIHVTIGSKKCNKNKMSAREHTSVRRSKKDESNKSKAITEKMVSYVVKNSDDDKVDGDETCDDVENINKMMLNDGCVNTSMDSYTGPENEESSVDTSQYLQVQFKESKICNVQCLTCPKMFKCRSKMLNHMSSSHNYRSSIMEVFPDWFVQDVCVKCNKHVGSEMCQVYHIGSTHEYVIELYNLRKHSSVEKKKVGFNSAAMDIKTFLSSYRIPKITPQCEMLAQSNLVEAEKTDVDE